MFALTGSAGILVSVGLDFSLGIRGHEDRGGEGLRMEISPSIFGSMGRQLTSVELLGKVMDVFKSVKH